MQELTAEGKAKLEQERSNLLDERELVKAAIKEAREHGDLSENAEYKSAKEKQAVIEGRLEELEAILRDVVVIDESTIDTTKVNVGVTVQMKNTKTKAVLTYRIVSTAEADIKNGSISTESPVGRALLGHTVGENVEVTVPNGTITYKIVSITKN